MNQEYTEEYQGALKEVATHRGAFSIAFLSLFIVLVGVLAIAGMLPDLTSTSAQITIASDNSSSAGTLSQGQGEAPIRIVAPSIKLDVTVSNPASTDLSVLDSDLLKGAVHYPGSAFLGVNGTVLIFGHSSYLPILNDGAYKTFDGIQNLKSGDIVSVYSATTEYRYSVTSVTMENATDNGINLSSDGQHLVLVTCDVFGEKTDRFVVMANFVDTLSLQ